MTDIPGSPSTTAVVHVGDAFTNSLETVGDHDWYAIALTAGQSITVTATGAGALDTYLNIYDASGTTILATNDDSGGTTNSRLPFTAPATGTYYIDMGAWHDQSSGEYTLFVEPSPPPVWTNDQIAYQLTSGYWGGDVRHFNVTQGGTITVNISTLNPAEQTLARTALGQWSDIIGVHFQEVTTGGQIVFSDAEDPSANGPVAQTDEQSSNGIISSAHVQISSSWVTTYGNYVGSYGFQTYLHEIGHALGLGHAGEYNFNATYSTDALFANDGWPTTVMSYFNPQENSYFNNQDFSGGYVVTPMVADIVAMQELYGLSTTTRTGDTTYGFHSNAGAIFDASVTTDVSYTIYDSGGIDTLDYSGFTADQLINLNPETFSNISAYTGNVSIARGVVIENAIGGWGNDTLIGNSANNTLDGGPGFNTISYEAATAGVTIDTSITGPQNTVGAGIDTLLNYVRLDGSPFDDTLSGRDGTANQQVNIHGGGGNDTLIASPDGDQLYGDAGNDTLIGGAGNDMLEGGDGNDAFRGGGGNDSIYADAGDDTITGGLGADQLIGGAGQDTFIDTAAGLNGDTINDLEAGEKIIITDANPSTFSFSVSGNTLTYTGGSLTFSAFFQGHWAYQAAPGGGVELWMLNENDRYFANDFNGDGRSDVLWRSSDGRLVDWLGSNGGGFVGNGAHWQDTVSSDWQVAGTGDFNGDGRVDILWRSTSTGQIADWLGTAIGGFSGNAGNSRNSVSPDWHVAGVGDFNGDGRSDILWMNDSGRIVDWLGTATGGFTGNGAHSSTAVAAGWQVAGTGDFNGDGIDDILWRNASTGRIADWLGNSVGGFTGNGANSTSALGAAWQIAGVGDFNRDGYSDILLRNSATGQVTDWLGTARGGFVDNSAHTSTLSTDWQVAGVGDYNGDAIDDILWRNPTTGQVTEWLGNLSGGFVDNSGHASSTVASSWHVEPAAHLL